MHLRFRVRLLRNIEAKKEPLNPGIEETLEDTVFLSTQQKMIKQHMSLLRPSHFRGNSGDQKGVCPGPQRSREWDAKTINRRMNSGEILAENHPLPSMDRLKSSSAPPFHDTKTSAGSRHKALHNIDKKL